MIRKTPESTAECIRELRTGSVVMFVAPLLLNGGLILGGIWPMVFSPRSSISGAMVFCLLWGLLTSYLMLRGLMSALMWYRARVVLEKEVSVSYTGQTSILLPIGHQTRHCMLLVVLPRPTNQFLGEIALVDGVKKDVMTETSAATPRVRTSPVMEYLADAAFSVLPRRIRFPHKYGKTTALCCDVLYFRFPSPRAKALDVCFSLVPHSSSTPRICGENCRLVLLEVPGVRTE